MIRALILAGDTRYNLGDTAICLAVVRLVRKVSPDSEIVVWGKRPCFPSGFEGVRFYSPFSLGGLWTLLGAQAVLWGGGQLLQGNRSRIKLLYWAGVVTLLRMLRKRIMGFAQGVGPFPRKFDRVLVRFAVNCTEVFTVRDPASLRTLEEINAPQRKIFLTADPALLLFPEATGNGRPMKEPEAVSQFHPDKHPTPTIGISFRYTRHHRSNRIIPFQFLPESLRRKAFESEDFSYFLATMSDLCDRIVVELHAGITFVPMYYAPWETDVIIAESLAQHMRHKDRVRIFRPSGGVEEIPELLRQVDAFVGTPMHATILSTSQHVPTLALHYEPKGRDFFQLIEQERWTFPLEAIWEPGGPDRLFDRIRALWQERDQVRANLGRTVPKAKKLATSNADHLAAFQSRQGKEEGNYDLASKCS